MANKKDKKYENELFERLCNNTALREEEAELGRYFEKPVWWMVQKLNKTAPITLKSAEEHCPVAAESSINKLRCINGLNEAFHRAKKEKKAIFFRCAGGHTGFCYPIAQGKKIYGYIAMCHSERELPRVFINLFIKFLDTLVREIQKELQLSKLYETIRPRAIALSTVHTIHRLLTSTLDLDELLQRMARLSLQIVRANRCSIKLVDRRKKVLLPKTTVDLRKKKVKLKKVKVGMYAPGKAFKKLRVVRGKDYMAIPLVDQDVIGVITLYDKIDRTPFNQFDQEIMSTLAEQAVIAINNALLYKEQGRLTEGTIKSLAALLDTQAPGKLTPRAPFIKIILDIGRHLKFSKEDLKSLQYAYLLHDVGKVLLPASVLSKKSKLTGREYRLIKEHPLRGAKIIRPLKALKTSAPMILHQRERYDGKGYPDKLRGQKIPVGARMISVVSAFESMTAKRPPKKRMTVNRALEEIKKNSGTQFDPKIVEVFLKVVNRHHIRELLRKKGYRT